MVQRKFVAMSVVTLVAGLLIGCFEPDDDQEPLVDITGTWYGLATEERVQLDDTFDILLNIEGSGFYRMVRSSIVHGSSLGNPDTLKELGTWSRIGSDSVVFDPDPDSCQLWDDGAEIMQTGPGLCSTPLGIKIAISGNSWTAAVMKFRDPDKKITTVMTKQ